MIEKMKKIFIISSAADKEGMINALMQLGAVHISEKKSADRQIADRFVSLSKTVDVLSEYAPKGQECAPLLSDKDFSAEYDKVLRIIERKNELEQSRSSALSEADRLIEWGDFSPRQIAELKESGIDLHFYRLGKDDLEKLSADESVRFIRLADVDKMHAIAVFGQLPSGYGALELTVPEEGLSQLRKTAEDCGKEIEECSERLKEASVYINSFRDQLLKLYNRELFSEGLQSVKGEGSLVWICGYIPENDLYKISELASEKGLAWAADDPSDEDEDVPTKVRYNKVTAKIKPLFDMLGILPGYHEQDVSLWFLIFFAIFTAMIIGDAAYGFIFLIVAIVLTVKQKKLTDAVFLVYVLSVATICWGAITGTWFGSEAAMNIPFLKALVIPQFANYPEYFGLTASAQQNTIMKLSFTLGVIQIALGCLLSIRKKISEKNLSFIADIGWFFAVIAMYLLSLNLVIGENINLKPVFGIIAGAFIIVVLFGGMSPEKSFSEGLKAGLGGAFTAFLDTISCFGNVMSYIRLFAVGMASLAIAQSFNGIASGFKGPMFVFAIVVLVIGHGLNIIMGLLSVVVHGVRLNVLEFSGQAGLEWTGIAYDPLKNTDKIKK